MNFFSSGDVQRVQVQAVERLVKIRSAADGVASGIADGVPEFAGDDALARQDEAAARDEMRMHH